MPPYPCASVPGDRLVHVVRDICFLIRIFNWFVVVREVKDDFTMVVDKPRALGLKKERSDPRVLLVDYARNMAILGEEIVLRRERRGFGGCTGPTIHSIQLRPVVVERLFCDWANNKATLDVGLQIQIDVTSNLSGSAAAEGISGKIQAAMIWKQCQYASQRIEQDCFLTMRTKPRKTSSQSRPLRQR
jgi:hypothetical protein